ncbi:MAG TPA: GntR family transcriptional regulator, partial [Eubacteriaceae bacterium]|nr:GntR family transcriptional regulator [Eubacteriaceae bacterium]
MEILIDNSSMQPIYEQIAEQIKRKIIREEFLEQDALPSVRTFAKELKISALTVKKAYDYLEKQGFIVTVHGKGSFVASVSSKQVFEEKRREVKEEM